ncbi:serine/arginine-rich splicing factor 3-like [Apostichopus japonicus]|uniref:serine/arginine-rich splicing factor 3-like n=1 Tax=Stichopus japonicus TaxID=307972 RepID=UPI003AB4AED9
MSENKAHYKDYGPLDCKVYIGGLGEDANRYEIWDEFEKFGTLRNVWVARNPPGFAFVEFKDHNDAADAVENLDQKIICKRRVRVQLSSGESRKGGGSRSRGQLCYECGRPGHLARECKGRRGRGRYPGKRYSRSRSRSRSYERKRSPSRSRSRSPAARRSRSRSRSRSPYKGAGRSYDQD